MESFLAYKYLVVKIVYQSTNICPQPLHRHHFASAIDWTCIVSVGDAERDIYWRLFGSLAEYVWEGQWRINETYCAMTQRFRLHVCQKHFSLIQGVFMMLRTWLMLDQSGVIYIYCIAWHETELPFSTSNN